MRNTLAFTIENQLQSISLTIEPEDWLRNFLPVSANTIKLGLEHITKAAYLLKLVKPAPCVITVAGTNGKGSVVKLLESLLTNLGFKVGCYTSPHLIKFNERISVNGTNIHNDEIINGFVQIAQGMHGQNLSLTYFEFITLAAWKIFLDKNLDFLIIEVGLGGRSDATNVIPKDLAVITGVDYDHQNYLGNTLELIGYEKAGIIAQDKPVILGSLQMPESIFTIAKMLNAQVHQYGVDYNCNEISPNKAQLLISSHHNESFDLNNLELDRNANYNIKLNNIATSLMALTVVSNHHKNLFEKIFAKQSLINYRQTISKTTANFNLMGRCHWLNNEKTILVDVAHNLQAITNLQNFLQAYCKTTNIKKVISVCGMLKDKDIKSCLKIMDQVVTDWYFTDINEPRGAQAEELVTHLLDLNQFANYTVYSDVISCYESASNIIKQNHDNDIILIVFGSFHVAGPVCDYDKNRAQN